MKKLFMTFVAAAALMLAACGGSGNSAAPDKGPVIPVDPSVTLDKTFEHEKFTVQYPSSVFEVESGADCMLTAENGYVSMSMTYNTTGPTMGQFQTLADNVAYMKTHDANSKATLSGNFYAVKSKGTIMDENAVVYSFGVIKEDYICIMGDFQIPAEHVAKYEKYVGAMVNSIKFK